METRALTDVVNEHPPLPAEHQLELAACVRRGIAARSELASNGPVLGGQDKGHDPVRRAELEAMIAAGDEAQETLVLHNTAMVLKIARHYAPYMPLEDLFQEGVIGLITAIERFDPEYGTQLSTHVYYWIRQAIGRAVANKSRTIRLSVHQHRRVHRLNKLRARMTQNLHREPTQREMTAAAREAGDAPLDIGVVELMQRACPPISLDVPVGDREDDTLADFVPDHDDPADDVERDVTQARILEAIDTLPPREAMAVKMKYGIGGYQPLKLHEIGDSLGVTRERARQIISAGLRRLRHPSRKRRLKGLL